MLQLEPGMLVWTWITFVAVLLVLWKVAWKPLLGAVESRENRINDSLQKAENARAEAEKLLAQQQEKLAAAQQEIQAMIKETRQTAEKMRADLLEQARLEAEKVKQRARSDIEKERDMMLVSLKQEVADLVLETTAKLVGVAVDKARHQKIIDDSIAGFGQKN